jgi:pSer/pThr/pTyr-binding forkhead associated (FHA) protein
MATGPGLAMGQLIFPLNKVTNSVGRKDRITNMVPDVDLGSLDQERSVSRRHAELMYEHGTISVRDIGSTNGTTVNGERLAHQVDRDLKDGDEVGFGAVAMVFVAAAEWPEGVEADWPPEPEFAPEETMIASPFASEETMIAGPGATEETMVAPPQDFSASETAIFTPDAAAGLVDPEAVTPSPDEASAQEALDEAAAPLPEPAPAAFEAPAAAAVEAPVYVACSNHSHLPAVGLCPGCLEAFCVDCLPEREDGLMVCNRCAGISYRLGAAGAPGASIPAPAMAAAATAPVPAGGDMPGPAPMPGGAPEDKKKKWPF